MSPASQGGVEVERYIGSCLISSNLRSGSQKVVAGKKPEPVIRGKSRSCYGGQGFASSPDQCQVHYGPGSWTGAPLISMTSSPRRCNQRSSPPLVQQQQQQQQQQQSCEQQASSHIHKNPLSRLAIHTQGAPLILASRFHNRGKINNTVSLNGTANAVCSNSYVHNNGNTAAMSNAARCPVSRPQRSMELAKKQQANPKLDCPANKETAGSNIANIDSLSIASDESSGSNNSENSLPRIIKPRKRRKKDRKPNGVASPPEVTKHEEQQQQFATSVTEQSNAIPSKSYAPSCYEVPPPHLRTHRRPPIARESVYRAQTATGVSMQEIVDARQRFAHRHVEVKVLDDNRNVVPAQIRAISKGYRHNGHHMTGNGVPRYLHEYNSLPGCEDPVKDGLGACQCRYCDPSALIWDVDQNCYSPFLTPSSEYCHGRFPHTLFPSRRTVCQGQSVDRLFGVDNCRARGDKDTGVVLRRSWSDPSSYFSEEIAAPSKDVGVIGDRGQPENGKQRTLWRGDMGIPVNNVGSMGSNTSTAKGLEVSTEIITSPNGHRDLEIKFYSPSPNAPVIEGDKIVCAEEGNEEEEDFSDIWSYHDSKLQQDFRTLLQAEE